MKATFAGTGYTALFGRSSRLLSSVFLILSLVLSSELSAQKFHFGASAGVIASQVDGDDLSGFNKFGYQAGLLGGYSLNPSNWIIINLEYASFGSKVATEFESTSVELDLGSIDILAAYSMRFGDTWDGQKRFRFVVGPKFHRFIEVNSPDLDRESIRNFMISGHFGLGFILTPSFILDLSYTHSFTNIFQGEPVDTDKLVPYYLSVGVSYYLNRGEQ